MVVVAPTGRFLATLTGLKVKLCCMVSSLAIFRVTACPAASSRFLGFHSKLTVLGGSSGIRTTSTPSRGATSGPPWGPWVWGTALWAAAAWATAAGRSACAERLAVTIQPAVLTNASTARMAIRGRCTTGPRWGARADLRRNSRRRQTVRIRLQRNAVVAFTHAELVGGSASALQLHGVVA